MFGSYLYIICLTFFLQQIAKKVEHQCVYKTHIYQKKTVGNVLQKQTLVYNYLFQCYTCHESFYSMIGIPRIELRHIY